MPAKTVVFTSVRKWDGDSHQIIGSGEYIQMSGRAGHRGKDERGICIIMIDKQMEMNTLKDMALPDIGESVLKLEKEVVILDASGEQISIACLKRNELVLVSAHTPTGKTVVAEYAIAMASRDKQRVFYAFPLKSLSNQKYWELTQEFSDVGLMTGDVIISPNTSYLVMTTEILHGMLYRSSEMLKEVAWDIFDEIHYMRNRERGVVWEESIIFFPSVIKMKFLSATMPNATEFAERISTMPNAIEFAEWICNLHKQPFHAVYTDLRPTPLQHYVFPVGGLGLYLVVDENEQFKDDHFVKLQDTFTKQVIGIRAGMPILVAELQRMRHPQVIPFFPSSSCLISIDNLVSSPGNYSQLRADLEHLSLQMTMERKLPIIIFSFSRRECEKHAMSMSKLNFNTENEKDVVKQIYENAILCLNEEDRNLPAIELIFSH
ncbi:hypothetical protein GIB67_041514 [Kingdonia uniflora]|uniref:Helicase ATP-binding domain-containing protein n=1 Tax=Kingdonia uniflora TaxID=39325 RepID=A0A7J7MQ92_9MAGN|nr:hypothetical protein GIB67_041514 [Kingdonia uniflora]